MKTHIHTHTQHSVQEEWNRAAQHLPQLLTKMIVKLPLLVPPPDASFLTRLG